MITYLLILINISFLTNKNNININNDFVKNHTKTAILIHLGFLINTIIFAYFWLGFSYSIIWYNISDIIAISIYLVLFIVMIHWIYKAYLGQTFKLSETLDFKNNKNLLDITNNWKFSEKDKLTIIFSLIPFIWFIISPKYQKNKLIENNVKLNLIISFIIVILYIFGNPNLTNLLLLIYIIFIVFSWVNLFTQDKVINLNLEKLPTPTEKLNYLKAFTTYLWNYFKSSNKFENFDTIHKKIKSKNNKNYLKIEKELQEKSNFKLTNYLIYIPVLNLISLFDINTKQKKHIINWLLISYIFIIIIILNHFFWTTNNYLLFLLFPTAYGFGYMKAWVMNYEIPFLFSIYNIIVLIQNKFKKIFTKAKILKNTTKEINLKVWENK